MEKARGRGFERLAADNARAWRARWETDIEIEGSPELQRVVRSMLVLPAVQRGLGHHARHPADGALQRGLLRARLLGLRYLDVPLPAADPPRRRALAGGLPGAHAGGGPGERASQRISWRHVPLGGR